VLGSRANLSPFVLSLSKDLYAVVAGFAGLLTVGRGLPGGKSLSFVSPKESNPRKGDPDIPEFPKIEPAGRAAKNSPRFC
jgi:hypothetical protein